MFGEHFYHKQIRNTVIAFGTIFNNINIKRLDSSGNPLQNIKIPLSYSPKEKFIARLDQQSSLTGSDSSVAITLPRMAFDITGYAYDPTRKLNKNQKIGVVTTNADTTKLNTQYSPVPYDVSIELNVFTANSDDGLQIIEQILPYFQPDYTVTMIESRTMDTKRDIPFILESVNYEDSYAGDLTTTRRITYALILRQRYICMDQSVQVLLLKPFLLICMTTQLMKVLSVKKGLLLRRIQQLLIKTILIHTPQH